MNTYIEGKCDKMCSDNEIEMRSRQKLIHFFEMDNKNQQSKESKKGIFIKEFVRSAAGKNAYKSSDLRTPLALSKTVEYLLTIIIQDKRKPYYFVYEFIFDRLRSVRQEIVMQNFNIELTIQLLEPIVLFLAFSSYKLCEEEVKNYDPKICEQHLQECLKKLLCCYDQADKENSICYKFDSRCLIESLYLVLNLGITEALTRGISLSKNLRNNQLIKLCLKCSLDYFIGNYYACIKIIDDLPHIICAVISLKIQMIRFKMLKIFAVTYHNKTFTVSVNWLQKVLLYENLKDVIIDFKHYNIEIKECREVLFNKNIFDETKGINRTKHFEFVNTKLDDIFTPDIMLLRF